MEEIVTSFKAFKRSFEQLMGSYQTLTDTKDSLIYQSSQNAFKVLQQSVDEMTVVDEVGPVPPCVPSPPGVEPDSPPGVEPESPPPSDIMKTCSESDKCYHQIYSDLFKDYTYQIPESIDLMGC
jgi:hypothetical protein